ncbi:MAG: insulinase family protein [Gemmatimonadetes bacterium]|nr:insulinase family protein [Gemmatimonadota bacterium]
MRLLRSTLAALAATAALSAPVALAAQAGTAPTSINIPHERYTLPNGLTVVLAEDHTVPRVAVDVWYHVGSKNEKAGRTGFAHMFEHVMFTGSGHVPYGTQDRYTEGVGGFNNGSTNNDRTNYYEEVPSNYLEIQLWLEADRMGFLLDKLDSAKFVAQRDIVQNERRQRTDNQPYGRSFEILTSMVLPESHPYAWPVVGYMVDLQKATVEDVKDFFRLYYAPNNATLAIVGDFKPAEAKAWIAKYFDGIPRGKPIVRPTVPAVAMSAVARATYEDRVQVPRLYLAWPTVGDDSEDDKVLDIIAALLAGPRTARLTKALVYDQQAAAQLGAFQATSENFGLFLIQASPRPGHTLTEIESTVDTLLDRFKREGPTADELMRAQAGIEFGFVSGLESLIGKGETLLNGAVYHGDPGYYRTLYTKLKSVSADDVKRVANKYFTAGRAVLSVVPPGKPELASRAGESRKVTVAADGGHYLLEGK